MRERTSGRERDETRRWLARALSLVKMADENAEGGLREKEANGTERGGGREEGPHRGPLLKASRIIPLFFKWRKILFLPFI